MSAEKMCPKIESCAIFNTPLGGDVIIKSYRNQFCYNGHGGQNNCKRFLVAELVGNAPLSLLPNSRLSVDDIIFNMRVNGEI
ncbi:MAG: hypothetical protein RIS47_358 [Bacteroidota bacterium]|jgi:hypothetical protein